MESTAVTVFLSVTLAEDHECMAGAYNETDSIPTEEESGLGGVGRGLQISYLDNSRNQYSDKKRENYTFRIHDGATRARGPWLLW